MNRVTKILALFLSQNCYSMGVFMFLMHETDSHFYSYLYSEHRPVEDSSFFPVLCRSTVLISYIEMIACLK